MHNFLFLTSLFVFLLTFWPLVSTLTSFLVFKILTEFITQVDKFKFNFKFKFNNENPRHFMLILEKKNVQYLTWLVDYFLVPLCKEDSDSSLNSRELVVIKCSADKATH